MRKIGQFASAIAGAVAFFSSVANAIPLTDEIVRSARKIVFVVGTFDPIHNGHIAFAENAMREGDADLVILLPRPTPLGKTPMPMQARVDLIDLALSDHPSISYGFDGKWRQLADARRFASPEFAKEIRRVNPSAKIAVAVGEDLTERARTRLTLEYSFRPDEILVNPRNGTAIESLPLAWRSANVRVIPPAEIATSSTEIRGLLRENFELYLMAPSERESYTEYRLLSRLLPKALLNHILDRGAFLRPVAEFNSPLKKIKRFASDRVRRILEKLGLYESVKSHRVARSRIDGRDFIDLGGINVPVVRHLGSGLNADAYLVAIDGEFVAVKVAKPGKNLLESVPIHYWALFREGIRAPELLAYDTEGGWIASDFVEGPSLAQHIAMTGGLSEDLRGQLRDLYDRMVHLENGAYIALDFAADNIIVSDGKIYLVDLGPAVSLPRNFDAIVANWVSGYTARGAVIPLRRDSQSMRAVNRCENVFGR